MNTKLRGTPGKLANLGQRMNHNSPRFSSHISFSFLLYQYEVHTYIFYHNISYYFREHEIHTIRFKHMEDVLGVNGSGSTKTRKS